MIQRIVLFTAVTLLSACATVSQKSNIDVAELTIDQAHHALRSRQYSCESLVNAYLLRIKQLDQADGLNAITQVNPRVIQRARSLDDKFARTGQMKPLHCVPLILKDNFDTHDMPTEGGSRVLKGVLPPDDSFIVKRLRENDALILAKSNMGEWAFSPHHTISSTHGETRNPYNLEHVPAGSSGGTAAAVAANLGLVGMGTDTGNSVRGPSSHASLVGMRSTLGVTSRDGIIPLLVNRDVAGPMTRTVRDNVLIFEVIAGYDPADPYTRIIRDKPKQSYQAYLKKDGLKGLRIAVLDPLLQIDKAHPEVLRLMQQAIEDMQEQGAELITEFFVPDYDVLRAATGFCSRFRYDLANYLASLGDAAPVKALDEIVSSKAYLPHNQEAMDWAMGVNVSPEQQQPPCVDVEGDPRRKKFLTAVVDAMDDARVDLLIYPSWSYPARKLGDSDSPHGNNSGEVAPHTGQPAITVPMGYTKQGLPAGLQFLGRPFSEGLLYQAAYAYEQATLHRRPPPTF